MPDLFDSIQMFLARGQKRTLTFRRSESFIIVELHDPTLDEPVERRIRINDVYRVGGDPNIHLSHALQILHSDWKRERNRARRLRKILER